MTKHLYTTATLACKRTVKKSWHAQLILKFTTKQTNAGIKTVMSLANHQGPLRVQRPFYPIDEQQLHSYILHPPGGLVSGDQISITIHADKQSHVLVTSPAAGKFYGAKNFTQNAQQNLFITVEDDALLQWLPQETIVFNSAIAKMNNRIYLHKKAQFVFCDVICLGRLKSGEHFSSGQIHQNIELYLDHKLLHIERFNLNAQDPVFHSSAGFNKQPVFGSLLIYHQRLLNEETIKTVQNCCMDFISTIMQTNSNQLAFTIKSSLLLIRYLGNDSAQAQQYLRSLWQNLSPIIMQSNACPARIWKT